MKYRFPLFSLVALVFVLLCSCTKEDDFITDAGAKLSFSIDTLRFDTVFTAQGSATRIIKVYNRNDQAIRIDKISIAGVDGGFFRMNVDGIAGNSVSDVKIAKEDSLYIFVEVTVDPDQDLSASPFVLQDQIDFLTNGNEQRIVLEAWGQNANYIPNRFNSGGLSLFSCDFGDWTWDDPKPYVIFGQLYVDSCTLNIPPGTQVYVHGGIQGNLSEGFFNDGFLVMLPNGKLKIEGTLEEPVVFQGDRLEEEFDDVSGQWSTIFLSKTSKGHEINHAIIKNSRFGIVVDSAADLKIKNTQIYNTSSAGIIGSHSSIQAENCLFWGSGANCVLLRFGGNYDFSYCTIASYGVDASALGLTNFNCIDPNDPLCIEKEIFTLNANFKNSIIFGSRRDEIELADGTFGDLPASFNYNFDKCIVRVDELDDNAPHTNFFDRCDCINETASNPMLFVDPNDGDYHLDTLSIAEGQAIPINGITLDLDREPRDPMMPDLGCYEYTVD
ncbi:MAG: right-handed parallel beta-helix repeat-containing protein [Saprospiraceae bacterium]